MSDHCVVSQYYSFVIILDGSGTTCPTLDIGTVFDAAFQLMVRGCKIEVQETVNKNIHFCQASFAPLSKWCPWHVPCLP